MAKLIDKKLKVQSFDAWEFDGDDIPISSFWRDGMNNPFIGETNLNVGNIVVALKDTADAWVFRNPEDFYAQYEDK